MEKEKRLIDANILESWIDGGIQGAEEANGNAPIVSLYDVLSALDDIPTVDAVEVVHGRWEKHGKHDWRCSVCKVGVPYSFTGHNYCHNCGAKMDGGGDNG